MASDTHIDPIAKAVAIEALRAGEISPTDAARLVGCSRAAVTGWARTAGIAIAQAHRAFAMAVFERRKAEHIARTTADTAA